MEYKKTNEVYIADQFNRDTLSCCADAAIATSISASKGITLPNSYDYAGISQALTCNTTAINSIGITDSCVKIDDWHNSISTLNEKIQELQKKIEYFERRQTVTSNLRSALRTLKYEREVE